jgi:glutamine synthetase
VPGGPANTRHIEHRICGADANPYLAAAAILAGIHRGIREQLDRARRSKATAMPRPPNCCPPTG